MFRLSNSKETAAPYSRSLVSKIFVKILSVVITIKKLFIKIFPDRKDIFNSAILGISFAGFIYLGLLQRHFFSRRYVLYAFLIAGFVMIFSSWLNENILFPKFWSYSKNIRVFIIIFSFLFGIMLILNTNLQPIYYLLPDSTLEINIPIGDVPQDEEGISLLWIETGQGYVHYTSLDYQGKWERVFGNTIFSPNQTVSLQWVGKIGPKTEIAFRHTKFSQPISISWNGQENEYQLNNLREPIIFIRNQFKIPIFYFLPFILCFFVSVTYGIFSLIVLIGNWEITDSKQQSRGKYYWLLFMLPMLFVWCVSLMVFWPGIMSNDSLALWKQGVQGDFNDWQSAFYSISIALIYHIWYSPAFIVFIQIFLLSLTTAWGLKILGDYGVPLAILWILSIAFAIFPPNIILSVTLWRDIPYAISFLLFTILFLCIALTKGRWAYEKHRWIWVGVTAFLLSVLRKNGVPVALVSLLLLPIMFRKYWKTYLKSLIFAFLLYIVVKGPIYGALNVNEGSSGKVNLVFLHHIAAHIDAGTELLDSEREYLNSMLPIEDWNYSPCYVGTISYNSRFIREDFLANTKKNGNLAFKLFLRNPVININHVVQAGELSWKFENNSCYIKSTHGMNSWKPGEEDWIIPNDIGLNEASLLPNLIQPYIGWLRHFGFFDIQLVAYLRPAFWLYLTIFSLVVLVVRRKDFHVLIPGIPLLCQPAVLLLVSFAPSFRYYYGTCLVGILLLGLIFIPNKPKEAQNNPKR